MGLLQMPFRNVRSPTFMLTTDPPCDAAGTTEHGLARLRSACRRPKPDNNRILSGPPPLKALRQSVVRGCVERVGNVHSTSTSSLEPPRTRHGGLLLRQVGETIARPTHDDSAAVVQGAVSKAGTSRGSEPSSRRKRRSWSSPVLASSLARVPRVPAWPEHPGVPRRESSAAGCAPRARPCIRGAHAASCRPRSRSTAGCCGSAGLLLPGWKRSVWRRWMEISDVGKDSPVQARRS